MNYNIINSGSDGNCIIINDFFMLDCGLSYKKINQYLNKVKLIFISHVHLDHLKKTTIKKIAYNYPNIKFICGSKDIVEILINCNIDKKNIFALESNQWYCLGMLEVRLETLNHDVPNHLCKFKINNQKGIYIIDTDNVDNIEAKDYDLYLIESNYKKELLEKHKKEIDEQNKFDYMNRVEHVHLSYEQAIDFLIKNMSNKSVYELIHKSKYNFEEEKEK